MFITQVYMYSNSTSFMLVVVVVVRLLHCLITYVPKIPYYYRFIEWEDFSAHAMVPNPKSGTAVLPKMITEVIHPSQLVKSSHK